MKQVLTRAAMLMVLGGAASAQVATGLYNTHSCAEPNDGRLEVTATELHFYESTCQISNGELVRDFGGAATYDAECIGEGETWNRRIFMMQRHDGGLIMLSDGFSREYERCN